VSAFLKQRMEQYCARTDIHVIANPIDFKRFSPTVSRKDGIIRLIAVGSLEPRKNFSLLLKALGEVATEKPVELVVIGSGVLLSRLEQEANALGVAHRVHWLGSLPNTQVASELSRSDIFISLSRLETFGVAIVEALACGIPVIATQSGGPDAYIQKETGVLVPQDDMKALVMSIQKMIAELESYDRAVIRETARRRFDFPIVANQVDQLYMAITTTS
jgi:glycosyltransferase involved in cell wall biosynthesis